MPPIPPKKILGPAQEADARAGLAAGLSRDDVANLIGVSRSILEARLRDQLRDCRPGRGRGGHRPPTVDPTLDAKGLARVALAARAPRIKIFRRHEKSSYLSCQGGF